MIGPREYHPNYYRNCSNSKQVLAQKKKHQFHRQTFLNIRNVPRFYLEGFKGDKLKLVSILFITIIIIIIIIINPQVHQDHMDITIIFGVKILFNLRNRKTKSYLI